MEEINETALTELVTGTLEESNFDYSDVSEAEKDELIKIKLRKGVIIHATIVEIGSDLKKAQNIYSKKGYGRFTKWVEEEYGMPYRTAKRYIDAYDVLTRNEMLNMSRWQERTVKRIGVI